MAKNPTFSPRVPPHTVRVPRSDFLHFQDRERGFQVWNLQNRPSSASIAKEDRDFELEPVSIGPKPRFRPEIRPHIHDPAAADRVLPEEAPTRAEARLAERRVVHVSGIRGQSESV